VSTLSRSFGIGTSIRYLMFVHPLSDESAAHLGILQCLGIVCPKVG
jgi:hypothetical protein